MEAAANKGPNKGLANLRMWKPGQSGNPSGRPKDTDKVAAYIRDQTKGGREIADCVMRIMRRQEEEVTNNDVIKASTFLWDRGLGKPSEIAPVLEGLDIKSLDTKDLEMLYDILRKLRPSGPGGDSQGTGEAKAS